MTFETALPTDAHPVVLSETDPLRAVRIDRLPCTLPPEHAAGSFVEESARTGTSAYWLRVLQHDGAMAWSSPVFVTFPGA